MRGLRIPANGALLLPAKLNSRQLLWHQTLTRKTVFKIVFFYRLVRWQGSWLTAVLSNSNTSAPLCKISLHGSTRVTERNSRLLRNRTRQRRLFNQFVPRDGWKLLMLSELTLMRKICTLTRRRARSTNRLDQALLPAWMNRSLLSLYRPSRTSSRNVATYHSLRNMLKAICSCNQSPVVRWRHDSANERSLACEAACAELGLFQGRVHRVHVIKPTGVPKVACVRNCHLTRRLSRE
jgi:hypothetical protein